MSGVYLSGRHVTASSVVRIASLIGATPWPSADKPVLTDAQFKKQAFPTTLSLLADKLDEDELARLLETPVVGLIDANALDESAQNFMSVFPENATNTNALGILMTCPVIYASDIAKLFTQALQKRLFFSKSLFESIHLALHESLVNGLIHGNLQLSSTLRQSARDFIEYARLLNERLNDPAYAQKSMSLMAFWTQDRLEIKIRDEGAGYSSVPTVKVAAQPTQAKSGRGLRLIAGLADSCTLDDFGREVTLSFLLQDRIEHTITADTSDEDKYETTGRLDDPDLSQCRVLVMEDNHSNQAVLTRLLNVVGITHIQIASDGIEGLHKVLSFKPDLIILDITMPRMNGEEVLYHLKSAPETRHIPVLVQTASDTREMREKAFSSGATDFITKPINPLEFFARVKVHLENRILIYSLRHQLDQIELEMQSARRMQVDMLPHVDHMADVCQQFHIQLAQYFEPSSLLGGDYWQMFPIRGELLGFYLCDFSGHGIAAALNTFRLHGIIAQMNKRSITTPSAFLETINRQLFELLPRGQFATFFFGIYNPKENTLDYAAADAPTPFLCSRGKTTLLRTSGLPLGIMRDTKYTDYQLKLKVGDTLFLYSDALTESPSLDGKRLGTAGFQKFVEQGIQNPNAQIALRHVMNLFFEFAPPPPPDDVTAILFRVDKAGDKS